MSYPTYPELVGHTFADIDGAGLSHRQWMANVGAGFGGLPVMHAINFAYNTPNLATGAPLYTPTVGDWLVNGWIEVTTAWDGTTPLGDFGLLTAAFPGFLATMGADIGIANAAVTVMTAVATPGTTGITSYPVGLQPLAALAADLTALEATIIPGRFVTADPICAVVSTDGTVTGGDPGATQGAARLILVTSSPRLT